LNTGVQEPPPRLHLLADSADRHTICGIRITHPKAMPFVLAAHLEMHQQGRGPIDVCPACTAEVH
jgi:hypothetical protein